MSKIVTYEVWKDGEDNSISVFAEDNKKMRNLLSAQAFLLRRIQASSFDECMEIHHKLMGWGTYKKF